MQENQIKTTQHEGRKGGRWRVEVIWGKWGDLAGLRALATRDRVMG